MDTRIGDGDGAGMTGTIIMIIIIMTVGTTATMEIIPGRTAMDGMEILPPAIQLRDELPPRAP
jgi:hypothetical protein